MASTIYKPLLHASLGVSQPTGASQQSNAVNLSATPNTLGLAAAPISQLTPSPLFHFAPPYNWPQLLQFAATSRSSGGIFGMPPAFFAATAASAPVTTPFDGALTAAMSQGLTSGSSLFARQGTGGSGGLLQACAPPPANLSSPEKAWVLKFRYRLYVYSQWHCKSDLRTTSKVFFVLDRGFAPKQKRTFGTCNCDPENSAKRQSETGLLRCFVCRWACWCLYRYSKFESLNIEACRLRNHRRRRAFCPWTEWQKSKLSILFHHRWAASSSCCYPAKSTRLQRSGSLDQSVFIICFSVLVSTTTTSFFAGLFFFLPSANGGFACGTWTVVKC